MRFHSPKQLKLMLCNYAIANGYQLCYKKNDNRRLLVKCCSGQCKFRLWASWMSEEKSFQIKSLIDEHNCARNFKLGSIVSYAWIGSHFTTEFLQKQKMSVRMLREEVKQAFGIDVSMGQCRRAKKHAIELIEGTLVEHYSKLQSYGEEIRRSNPGSTVKIDVTTMPDGKNYFSKFYVCFEGLKQGWRGSCRRVINLDGCFLKGLCTGELIIAVGRDANNHIFPIAWAVVCVENKENWKWFLENLKDDLGMDNGFGIALMSDQHKGLLEAVKEILPTVEHRQCARHVVANFRKIFPGVMYEKMFWKACKASTEPLHNAAMKEIQLLNPSAFEYLTEKNPRSWCRDFFEEGKMCDAVENGLLESFNNVIRDSRKKPIITMLEEIRLYVMERQFHLSMKGSSWPDFEPCPSIRSFLNQLKKAQRYWQVLPSGLNQFETRNLAESYVVDLDKKTCSCRVWQLNGYGCVHSVATISYLNRDVGSYVDPMFFGAFYRNAYKYPLRGMNGSNIWPSTNFIPPLPPLKRKMPGRPKVNRKKDLGEKSTRHTVSKVGKKILCSVCKQVGHNKATCPKVEKPKKLKVKRKRSTTKGGNEEEGSGSKTTVGRKQKQSQVGNEEEGSGSKTTVARKRKQSEKIIKKKLAKRVEGKNGEGNSGDNPFNIE
ncbi:uncharacterized protein LOC111903098 [Lactuca sativa]|uniref:uncharacterized protein LOC111903098 n=1 Tax=Lactuca sativa TaxID=4236 RepID=UPI0022AE5BAA|nr:uncharacterized protein LOC111903098 [Lactuca sativa]